MKSLVRLTRWSIPGLFVAICALMSPQQASAAIIFASDCSFGFKNVYLDNEPVCAVVTPQIGVFGTAVACVVPPGGQPAQDVTPGGCNAVAFAPSTNEHFLWLPPTVPGTYDVLVAGTGGAASDRITILSSGGAAPTVNVAAIKGAAAAAAAPWQTLADWGAYIDEFASSISVAWAVATGDWVSAAVGVVGIVTGQPTDYNGAVLDIGGQIIAALAGQQAAKYTTLANDPPDPQFTDVAPVDVAAISAEIELLAPLYPGVPLPYPYTPLNQDSRHLAHVALANSMAEESAQVFALMRTLEKFQGAEAASNDEFILMQAKVLKKYADQLGSRLATTRQAALNYKTELQADGLADIVHNSAEIAALIARLQSSGLTPAEEQDLRDSGFTDPDIELVFERTAFFPAPNGTYTRGGALDGVVAGTDQMLAAVQDLSGQAQDVIDHFSGIVTVQHPTADAGGAYSSDEGVAVDFDGSNSSDPQGQSLTFEWDLDLDGQFDDAQGAMASRTYIAPIATQVGLRVTDTDGNEDIAYANVVIFDVNGPPQITSFIPIDLAPVASALSPLVFTASAIDPDSDPLTFEWRNNGVVVSNVDTYAFMPNVGDTGTRTVRLTVSDQNPLSEDAIETRSVLLLDEVMVPNVVGMTQANAAGVIAASRLAVGTVSTANHPAIPAGSVINQSPVGGTTVLAGTAVDLVVSAGPADVTVPDVVGLPQASAQAAIVSAGLNVGAVSTANSAVVPAGNVISQNPAGGATAAPGSTVDLVVSAGPADVTVPDVVGLPQASAQATIASAGLNVGAVSTANSAVVPAGNVISQNPAGGATAAPGSNVDLVVSAGPADVTVPDVVGLPQASAQATIASAGLNVGAVSTANSAVVPAGNVISQNPAGGATAAPGSNVDLVVSAGPADVTVPDVVGLPQASAQAAIVSAGLNVGAVSTANSAVVPAGNVISQNPAGGATAAPGSNVDLVVSAGPGNVPLRGDADGDGDVDLDDIDLILQARNTPASGADDPRDLNGDGNINVLDARQAVLNCTNPRCDGAS